jgi:hypothetical protein
MVPHGKIPSFSPPRKLMLAPEAKLGSPFLLDKENIQRKGKGRTRTRRLSFLPGGPERSKPWGPSTLCHSTSLSVETNCVCALS